MKYLLSLILACASFNSFADIELTNVTGKDLISGQDVTIKDLKTRKYTIFYFLNSLCPCSQAHFDHLNELNKKYPDYQFIGFNSNKKINEKQAKAYYNNFKINFPVILDQSLTYANVFKALKTPHVFVVNKKGEIVFKGGATNSRDPLKAKKFYLKDALTALHNGKQPSIKVAKTIGCYIDRR